MFLNNQQVTEEVKRENKKFLETNDSENTTQNLWDAVQAMLTGKFIAIQAYLKKQERHQINNIILYLKHLENEEQKNPKVSRGKKIIKIREEMKETTVKINKTKSWFFEKINKIDKPLVRLIKKKKREKNKITKLEMKREFTTVHKYKGL